ncbi:MAG: NADH-quinone oxidoreductase subunit C [Elusimicrobia bacterium]|nr:NADH-quinone oxidoreductase subunit C [Elusimicrobiota bacterium]
MTPQALVEFLQAKFDGKLLESGMTGSDPFIRVAPEDWLSVAQSLRETPELQFDYLMCLSSVDRKELLEAVYHFYSYPQQHRLEVKVAALREAPKIPSVVHLWKTADWHEREAYDLMGIEFTGHPHLSRILLPDDWVGHPLRKDYQFPTEYHGIDHTGRKWLTLEDKIPEHLEHQTPEERAAKAAAGRAGARGGTS